MNINDNVRQRFGLIRKMIGASQQEIADWLKCAPSSIVNYEKGKTNIPLKFIEKFNKHGVPLHYFFDEDPLRCVHLSVITVEKLKKLIINK